MALTAAQVRESSPLNCASNKLSAIENRQLNLESSYDSENNSIDTSDNLRTNSKNFKYTNKPNILNDNIKNKFENHKFSDIDQKTEELKKQFLNTSSDSANSFSNIDSFGARSIAEVTASSAAKLSVINSSTSIRTSPSGGNCPSHTIDAILGLRKPSTLGGRDSKEACSVEDVVRLHQYINNNTINGKSPIVGHPSLHQMARNHLAVNSHLASSNHLPDEEDDELVEDQMEDGTQRMDEAHGQHQLSGRKNEIKKTFYSHNYN